MNSNIFKSEIPPEKESRSAKDLIKDELKPFLEAHANESKPDE